MKQKLSKISVKVVSLKWFREIFIPKKMYFQLIREK